VDDPHNPELNKDFSIQGYPTVVWFVDGEAFDYTGDSDYDSILSWIEKQVNQRESQKAIATQLPSVPTMNNIYD
jgi:thioredoxin-like negative regulator of GroEL